MEIRIKGILACGFFSIFWALGICGINIEKFWQAVLMFSLLSLSVQNAIETIICSSETHLTEKWAIGKNVFQTCRGCLFDFKNL